MKTLFNYLRELDKEKFANVLNKWNVSGREQEAYFSFIDKLLLKTPIDRASFYCFHEVDNEPDVSIKESDGVEYAVDFVPWEECLGCQIDESTFGSYSSEEWIFAILYEMTFDGFDEDTRQERLKELLDRTDG